MRIYCDMDGTVLSGHLNAHFTRMQRMVQRLMGTRIGRAVSLFIYDRMWRVDDLPTNTRLLEWLRHRRDVHGDIIVLWSDRGIRNATMTRVNLGDDWELFTEHVFATGRKVQIAIPEPGSVVIDDSSRVLDALRATGNHYHIVEAKF